MGRSPKTPKFDAFNSYENSFGKRQTHEKKWQDYLGPEKSLVLEVGCARAELLLTLAKANPNKNHIGIDRRSDRMYFPARDALEEGVINIAFIQTDIREIFDYLDEDTVDEIWLTFPDPYPKDRQEKHRMSGGKFLTIYHQLLKPGGILHFKTDNKELFKWSLEQLKRSRLFEVDFSTNDLHQEEDHSEAKILTVYEKKYLSKGLKTHYLRAVGRKD